MRAWKLETARLSIGISLSGARPMVTARLPSETSLSTASSNLSSSLPMSLTSSRRRCVRWTSGPAAQPRQQTLGAKAQVKHYDGDVILPAVLIGQLDQPIGGGLRFRVRDQV